MSNNPPAAESGVVDESLLLNGVPFPIGGLGGSLLDWLRDTAKLTGAKDGCSPQGQCGCCTVLVDGQPRVACVTPLRRVRGRHIRTLEGLERADAWAEALTASGGSQCGFCTPGIICRLDPLVDQLGGAPVPDIEQAVAQGLLAHLCRCTGWQTITEAAVTVIGSTGASPSLADGASSVSSLVGQESRDNALAAERAELEGRSVQSVGPHVALGAAGFSADSAPPDALIALSNGRGDWVVANSLADARAEAKRMQGRNSTASMSWPVEVPEGEWVVSLQTTWVEPAYLETDAAWCAPGGEPSPLSANGGGFGGKEYPGHPPVVQEAARQLADEYERPVLALASREDTVRWGPKRPPLAAGIDANGNGSIRVAATPGLEDALRQLVPDWTVETVAVPGPATSLAFRASPWAEILMLQRAWEMETGTMAGSSGWITGPPGGSARAEAVRDSDDGPLLRVWVRAGEVLDQTVLRSYCIGAAHMASSWVLSEGLSVDGDGVPVDLTIRSFGILRAIDMARVEVTIEEDDRPAVNGSDAVFAAVASAVWLNQECPTRLPTGRMWR